ncbi:MAG: flippase-like domain-containing protein [Nanoarchaeota archaeon]
MAKSKLFFLALGIIILLLIIYGIGYDKLIETIKNFDLYYLPLIFILLFLSYILAALNTWIIASGFKKISLKYVIKATFISLVYATIIPGKIADLLMIPLLKKQKLNFNQSATTLFLDKTISLFIKSIFALFGVIFIIKKFGTFFSTKIVTSIIIIILILTLFIIFIRSKLVLRFIKHKILRKYLLLFKRLYKTLRLYIKENKKYLFYNALITILKVFLETFLFFFLFLSFGQATNFMELFFVFSLLSIIILLISPIFGISGLGVREITGIFIFGIMGVNSAVVFNSFILKLLLTYMISLFVTIKFRKELNVIKLKKYLKKLRFVKRT